MNIGELFVSLGIKGSEKTIGSLKETEKGMKGLASMSLEAKAGIVGAMYALERLFASSNKAGTDLTNFNSLVGVSAKTLQQYQYAARQVGVSNEEVSGTFKGLQSAMTKTLMGEGAPKGLARLAQVTGGIDPEDIKRFSEHPEELLQRLQEYAQKESNIGLRNETLKSFGVGDGVSAALTRNAFRPEVLQKAPTYSDREIASLDKANAAWSNLGTKIQMAVGHFNALHGGQLVGDISKITDEILKLATAFLKFADKVELFKWIGKSFEGWSMILKAVTENVGELDRIFQGWKDLLGVISGAFNNLIGAAAGDEESKKNMKEGATDVAKFIPAAAGSLLKDIPNLFSAFTDTMFGDDKHETAKSDIKQKIQAIPDGGVPSARTPGVATPPMPGGPVTAPAGGTTQTVNVNQTLNFQHDGKDSHRAAGDMKKAVGDAFRQMSSQSRGT